EALGSSVRPRRRSLRPVVACAADRRPPARLIFSGSGSGAADPGRSAKEGFHVRQLYLALVPVAVLACSFAGCNLDNEPRPIDHKDEPGDYRQKVREGVEKRVGMRGQPVTGPDELVGSWDVAADTSLWELPPKPMFVYHLHADGISVVETTAGGGEQRNTG